jgi:arylformamidase
MKEVGEMTEIIDITYPLTPALTVWPGDTPVRFETVKAIGETSHSAVSKLTLSSHAGTHVDAPCHFVKGAGSVDSLDLSVLIGEALVVSVEGPEISGPVIETLGIPDSTARVIFKTESSDRFNGKEAFFEDFVGVTPSGAEQLLERGVKLIGIDYLSVAAHKESLEVHRLLLGKGVVLLETLDLKAVLPGPYQLVCLPLKLEGLDGSPARAVLIRPPGR